MRFPRRWRRWVVAAVVVILVVASIRALDSVSWIRYYRVVDDQTLSVGTITGHGAWTRVTSLTETPSAVTITVSSLRLQLGPGTADGVPVVTEVALHEPIGSRTVIDGSTGLPVKPCTHQPAYPTDCF
ncbi:MAG: hypothetical protein IVW53_14275 [Chloroflexi bacterium]|nr:hypothetical protein [Chloroflexota bacterium]